MKQTNNRQKKWVTPKKEYNKDRGKFQRNKKKLQTDSQKNLLPSDRNKN